MDIDEVLERGVADVLPSKKDLKEKMSNGKLTLYQGFDPSSPSLHIGNLIGIRKLAQFQELGHKVIFLVGDFTGMIGDPTDKGAARVRLTKEEVLENAKGYKEQIKNVLNFSGDNPAEIRYNSKWLGKLTLEELIDLSSNFTVQQLLERDMFRKRLEKERPVYLHEFIYPIMQGYDSVFMGVDLEIGGNDQLFNMLAGRNLMKALKDEEKYVLTTKLLTANDGKKMSKSEGTTVNLTDKPFDMYGKTMSLPDSFIESGLELLTDLPLDSVNNEDPMELKKKIAFEVVKQVHSEKDAKEAEENFEKAFQEGDIPENISEFSLEKDTFNIVDLLVETDLTESKSKAKRLISQGAVEVDGKKIKDPTKDVNIKKTVDIKVGKARFARVKK